MAGLKNIQSKDLYDKAFSGLTLVFLLIGYVGDSAFSGTAQKVAF
jgi:hypothetical protein